jgi:trk system potassium uptake protein
MTNQQKEGTIIAGCGRFSLYLASRLDLASEKTVVVDETPDILEKLGAEFIGKTVLGDAANIEVLHQAGIRNVKTVIAATDDDNVNLMIAHIARDIYEVPLVIALVEDAHRRSAENEGTFKVLCPGFLLAQVILGEIQGHAAETAAILKEGYL